MIKIYLLLALLIVGAFCVCSSFNPFILFSLKTMQLQYYIIHYAIHYYESYNNIFFKKKEEVEEKEKRIAKPSGKLGFGYPDWNNAKMWALVSSWDNDWTHTKWAYTWSAYPNDVCLSSSLFILLHFYSSLSLSFFIASFYYFVVSFCVCLTHNKRFPTKPKWNGCQCITNNQTSFIVMLNLTNLQVVGKHKRKPKFC